MDDDHIREHTVCCDFDRTAYDTSFATSHGDGGEIRGDGAEVIIKREPNANLINPKTEIKAIEYNFKKGATTVKTTVIYPPRIKSGHIKARNLDVSVFLLDRSVAVYLFAKMLAHFNHKSECHRKHVLGEMFLEIACLIGEISVIVYFAKRTAYLFPVYFALSG